jgi:Fe-S-cluster-containing hydrogenase component 2
MATTIDASAVLTANLRESDEGLFSRDINGQLVRVDDPTESDYEKQVTLEIDGRKVTVKQAEPLLDAQGNVVLDLEGRTTPRFTTVYDAALKAFDEFKTEGSGSAPGWKEFPIPILCHQPHMKPVAVCRICVVHIYNNGWPEGRLRAACQFQVKDGMQVYTMGAPGKEGDPVRKSVKVVTELLAGEHLRPAPPPAPAADLEPFNELKKIADRVGIRESRFKTEVMTLPAKDHLRHPMLDDSSPVFMVDRNACILCDRCSRACGEVKHNHIIGRTNKGFRAGIGFDLDVPMGRSGCVQCGECMMSCPTSAITFKPVAKVKLPAGTAKADVLTAAELTADPLLASVPPKFLLWQEGLVVRRRLAAGEYVFRQGQPGNTAFLIRSGRLEIVAHPETPKSERKGFFGFGGKAASQAAPATRFQVGPSDVIVGEMACLSGTPRTADLVALENTEVWELRRNVLDRMMRSPAQRTRFEAIYRKRAVDDALRASEVFQGLAKSDYDRCVEFLRPRLKFVRVSPGQLIFSQGDSADSMYLVRLGNVRVGIEQHGHEVQVFYKGPNTVLGEIGLLAITPSDTAKTVDELDRQLSTVLSRNNLSDAAAALPPGLRSANCSALDHVEMARIERNDFVELIREFPAIRRRLIELSLERIQANQAMTFTSDSGTIQREHVRQGLYQGQSLLVLNLNNCTRCDACTQACVAQHGTETHGMQFSRLLRDGLRFDNYLVATSCRSCKDAYCMIGCPVDSIHRGKHKQIVIESHCIGCGLCASNCPYGNIFMLPNENNTREVQDPANPSRTIMMAQPKAGTCDLCDAEGHLDEPKPRCVYACPHDAAFRMTGEELLAKVGGHIAEKDK